jgi:hypothetical protein
LTDTKTVGRTVVVVEGKVSQIVHLDNRRQERVDGRKVQLANMPYIRPPIDGHAIVIWVGDADI